MTFRRHFRRLRTRNPSLQVSSCMMCCLLYVEALLVLKRGRLPGAFLTHCSAPSCPDKRTGIRNTESGQPSGYKLYTCAVRECVYLCAYVCVCVCVCVCVLLCRVRIHEPRSSLTFDCFPLPTQHTTNRTSVCCRSNAAVKTASLRQHQDSASVSGAARSDTEFDGGVGGVTALPIRRFSASFHCVPCVR